MKNNEMNLFHIYAVMATANDGCDTAISTTVAAIDEDEAERIVRIKFDIKSIFDIFEIDDDIPDERYAALLQESADIEAAMDEHFYPSNGYAPGLAPDDITDQIPEDPEEEEAYWQMLDTRVDAVHEYLDSMDNSTDFQLVYPLDIIQSNTGLSEDDDLPF